MSTATHSTLATPLGPFTTIVDAGGEVLASGWTDDVGLLVPLIHPSLRPDQTSPARFGTVDHAVVAFHEGDPEPARRVRVRQQAGPFVLALWGCMRDVPAGSPVTYAELAARAGRPTAFRVAGAACARNVATLFVPCHRILRSDGGLGGFRWGTELKARLLEMESGSCRTPDAPSPP